MSMRETAIVLGLVALIGGLVALSSNHRDQPVVLSDEESWTLWAYAFDTPPKAGDKPIKQGNPVNFLLEGEDADELNKPWQAEGSSERFSRLQIRDHHNVIDWFPGDHPPMPDVIRHGPASLASVRGWACGSCHLPTGKGRPENAPVAGLPVEYFIQQLHDMRDGLRTSSDPRKHNSPTMINLTKAMSDQEMLQAAEYFASIPAQRAIEVIETDEIPEMKLKLARMHLPTESDLSEPLGKRIVEAPKDTKQANFLRNPRTNWLAYVPLGSLAKGEALVTSGANGRSLACASCHGEDLRGLGNIPSIAGRSPSYMMRQLYDFKTGARNGEMAATMQPVVANLSPEEMTAIVAYLASLEP